MFLASSEINNNFEVLDEVYLAFLVGVEPRENLTNLSIGGVSAAHILKKSFEFALLDDTITCFVEVPQGSEHLVFFSGVINCL